MLFAIGHGHNHTKQKLRLKSLHIRTALMTLQTKHEHNHHCIELEDWRVVCFVFFFFFFHAMLNEPPYLLHDYECLKLASEKNQPPPTHAICCTKGKREKEKFDVQTRGEKRHQADGK